MSVFYKIFSPFDYLRKKLFWSDVDHANSIMNLLDINEDSKLSQQDLDELLDHLYYFQDINSEHVHKFVNHKLLENNIKGLLLRVSDQTFFYKIFGQNAIKILSKTFNESPFNKEQKSEILASIFHVDTKVAKMIGESKINTSVIYLNEMLNAFDLSKNSLNKICSQIAQDLQYTSEQHLDLANDLITNLDNYFNIIPNKKYLSDFFTYSMRQLTSQQIDGLTQLPEFNTNLNLFINFYQCHEVKDYYQFKLFAKSVNKNNPNLDPQMNKIMLIKASELEERADELHHHMIQDYFNNYGKSISYSLSLKKDKELFSELNEKLKEIKADSQMNFKIKLEWQHSLNMLKEQATQKYNIHFKQFINKSIADVVHYEQILATTKDINKLTDTYNSLLVKGGWELNGLLYTYEEVAANGLINSMYLYKFNDKINKIQGSLTSKSSPITPTYTNYNEIQIKKIAEKAIYENSTKSLLQAKFELEAIKYNLQQVHKGYFNSDTKLKVVDLYLSKIDTQISEQYQYTPYQIVSENSTWENYDQPEGNKAGYIQPNPADNYNSGIYPNTNISYVDVASSTPSMEDLLKEDLVISPSPAELLPTYNNGYHFNYEESPSASPQELVGKNNGYHFDYNDNNPFLNHIEKIYDVQNDFNNTAPSAPPMEAWINEEMINNIAPSAPPTEDWINEEMVNNTAPSAPPMEAWMDNGGTTTADNNDYKKFSYQNSGLYPSMNMDYSIGLENNISSEDSNKVKGIYPSAEWSY
ncbi:hypothetical protein [Rickettsiales endosymbiont of Stachyamoeba lipophora]|uniref:hypothetical protein n=1 Tax=Rickettsiales endosymbiont of Stachyamoeba lipophora TaxID=2486578 RepID=UPI000F64D001|nr:hypothetical protein [Rickettsiales endosymbiont of Stachyamoeba lipophora]AZL15119.1 hypothetical protein EF513_00885 [Rickettsiales endosymbiont of Stachyamoeba lipophora]